MKSGLLVVLSVLLAASFLLTACGGGASAPAEKPSGAAGNAAKGADVYAGACIFCHGADAKGLPGLGKDMTTSEFIKGLPDAELIAFIKTGRPASDPANTTGVDMPPKGGNPALTDQDLADVVAYIRTLMK